MWYWYFIDFPHGTSVFANFSDGIAVLGTLQCPCQYVKVWYFYHQESLEHHRCEPLGGLGHALPEHVKILVLWNAISSVLRGQILSKMFAQSTVIFMLIFICVASCSNTRFYLVNQFILTCPQLSRVALIGYTCLFVCDAWKMSFLRPSRHDT